MKNVDIYIHYTTLLHEHSTEYDGDRHILAVSSLEDYRRGSYYILHVHDEELSTIQFYVYIDGADLPLYSSDNITYCIEFINQRPQALNAEESCHFVVSGEYRDLFEAACKGNLSAFRAPVMPTRDGQNDFLVSSKEEVEYFRNLEYMNGYKTTVMLNKLLELYIQNTIVDNQKICACRPEDCESYHDMEVCKRCIQSQLETECLYDYRR